MTTSTHCVVCPGRPAEANDGLVCFSCSNRILRWLRELEDYLPHLNLVRPVGDSSARGRPGFASQPPVSEEVLHHTDWRSGYTALDGLSALNTIHTWCHAMRETRHITPPDRIDYMSEIGALRTNHSWIIHQPAVAQYADHLRQIHAAVRRAAGDPIPKPVGRCIRITPQGECRGDVFELDDASGVRCTRCRTTYSGLDLARFRVAQDQEAS